MAQDYKHVQQILQDIEKDQSIEAYAKQVLPLSPEAVAKLESAEYSQLPTQEGLSLRQKFLNSKGHSIHHISGKANLEDPSSLKGNIENFIGMAQIPIGMAGPMLVRGVHTSGDFYVPLATTEGALVASYNRGMKATRLSGGISVVCLSEGVQRSPFFKFANILEVGLFLRFIHEKMDNFHKLVSETSRYAKLNNIMTNVEGNSVILTFEYYTGDAAGQNMVTICTDRICQYILNAFDIKPQECYIEGNYSGDKKATAISFSSVRGKKVTAEVVVPKDIVQKVLKANPTKVQKYWQSSTLGVLQSGAIGAQGHIANGLTALFIACGQDVACVSESSVGITRMELTEKGDLYVSVTLPSVIVGTIGGGTGLPTQKECLEMLGCTGEGSAKKFAEICACVALAGELSIASAMSAGHFTSAHQNLGRKK